MSLPPRTASTTDPEPVADAIDQTLLRAWAAVLAADEVARQDVRRLANGLLVAMEECEWLRRAGREAMAPEKVVVMFRDALLARGCQPPA